MKRKILLVIVLVVLVLSLFFIFFYPNLGQGDSVQTGVLVSNYEELFTLIRNSVNQHLSG